MLFSWEREERYELVDGVIRMTIGGSTVHAAVKGNLFAALRCLVRAPCRIFVGGPSLYPDVLFRCAPVVMTDATVRELIAEALPRTTAHHDSTTKWLSGCPGERILRRTSDDRAHLPL